MAQKHADLDPQLWRKGGKSVWMLGAGKYGIEFL
jgi:hypothetical protein